MGLFDAFVTQMAAGRVLGGVQYHALNHFASILSSVPEGQPVATLISNTLSGNPERIEFVPAEVISALRGALPIVEAAASAPSGPPVEEAYQKLQRIIQLVRGGSGVSQTMPRVLDPEAVAHAGAQMRQARARVESPAVRYLEALRASEPENSKLPVFTLEGRVVHKSGLPDLMNLLSRHFGSEVTLDSLNQLFGLQQEGYRIASVAIREERGHLRIAGEIRNHPDNAVGGFFGMLIPAAPESGTPWTAKVEAISLVRERLGIGTALLCRVALFLHRMGVHAMDANAMEAAGLFCVFNGFRVGKALYEDVVSEFVQDLERKGIKGQESRIRTQLLDRDSNLAELAAFEIDGQRAGRDFLEALFRKKYLPVRFELSADKQSWLRLLSNLHRDEKRLAVVPAEWNARGTEWPGLSPGTRTLLLSGAAFVGHNVLHLMSSDRDHAVHLVERVNNWAQSLAMTMDFPPQFLDRLPEDRKTAQREQTRAIEEVLQMLAAHASSSLMDHFRDLMDPSDEGMAGPDQSSRGFFIARTLKAASEKRLLAVPPSISTFFAELMTRE